MVEEEVRERARRWDGAGRVGVPSLPATSASMSISDATDTLDRLRRAPSVRSPVLLALLPACSAATIGGGQETDGCGGLAASALRGRSA
eukprot:1161587-Pelagomonas_calceolata.AAC.8